MVRHGTSEDNGTDESSGKETTDETRTRNNSFYKAILFKFPIHGRQMVCHGGEGRTTSRERRTYFLFGEGHTVFEHPAASTLAEDGPAGPDGGPVSFESGDKRLLCAEYRSSDGLEDRTPLSANPIPETFPKGIVCAHRCTRW